MRDLSDFILRYRRAFSVVAHALMAVAANLSAFWLRFDGETPPAYWNLALTALPWLVALRLLTFLPLRLFEGMWKYTSLWDLRNIILGIAVSSALFVPVAAALAGEQAYPRSIFIIDAVLLLCLMTGVRLSRRIYGEIVRSGRGRRVLIYGAGDAGEMIVRDMRHNPGYGATPIGFVDDDYRKKAARIHGLPVLGARKDLQDVVQRYSPDEVLIAIPSAPPQTMRDIVRALESFDVRITTLPNLSSLIDGHVEVANIRQLKVEDLLTRAPVGLDPERVATLIRGRRVLVTGAGGSIGGELCRQILQAGPARLAMMDRYENSLFHIHAELATRMARDDGSHYRATSLLAPVIGDITDAERLEQIFAAERPEVVFHAAAHKHVPLMEANPCEAVKNNVRGTRLVADAALRWGVERMVLISSDKAVNPTSVMGATKLLAERVIQGYGRVSTTRFCTVRFGNVLGSNGSVVPTFLEQIKAGGPVTVTHPEMRRFFMLIPEAVQLVLHAAALDDGRGCVYVLNMGDQIRVADMARDLIRLAGYVPDEDIEIVFTGVRPGEKLYEEFIGPGETAEPSEVPEVQRVRTSAPEPALAAQLERLEHAAMAGNTPVVLSLLRDLGLSPSECDAMATQRQPRSA